MFHKCLKLMYDAACIVQYNMDLPHVCSNLYLDHRKLMAAFVMDVCVLFQLVLHMPHWHVMGPSVQ